MSYSVTQKKRHFWTCLFWNCFTAVNKSDKIPSSFSFFCPFFPRGGNKPERASRISRWSEVRRMRPAYKSCLLPKTHREPKNKGGLFFSPVKKGDFPTWRKNDSWPRLRKKKIRKFSAIDDANFKAAFLPFSAQRGEEEEEKMATVVKQKSFFVCLSFVVGRKREQTFLVFRLRLSVFLTSSPISASARPPGYERD